MNLVENQCLTSKAELRLKRLKNPYFSEILANVFFVHANGVRFSAYQKLFDGILKDCAVEIFVMDLPGFRNLHDPTPDVPASRLWNAYAANFTQQIETLRRLNPKIFVNRRNIALGHSFGAWICIFAAVNTKCDLCIALDPVCLPTFRAFMWNILVNLGLRKHHPVAAKIRTRPLTLESPTHAVELFKRRRFFTGWDRAEIESYIGANYSNTSEGGLRHDFKLEVESRIFEAQPRSSLFSFYRLPAKDRANLNLCVYIGARSDVCNPKIGWAFRGLFPKSRVKIVDDAGHMFPFEKVKETTQFVVDEIKSSIETCEKIERI